jgi:hypothetical protein
MLYRVHLTVSEIRTPCLAEKQQIPI